MQALRFVGRAKWAADELGSTPMEQKSFAYRRLSAFIGGQIPTFRNSAQGLQTDGQHLTPSFQNVIFHLVQ
jgi:hypothetical protein